MKTITGLAMPALFGSEGFATQEAQAIKMPEPVKEHEWLHQLVGEWDVEVETYLQPDSPPTKTRGTETVRPIGGFWVVGESHGTFMGQPFTGLITLGYDPEKQKYTTTWIDSVSSHLWTFEGELEPTGGILTLEGEGPCPGTEQIVKLRDVLEIRDRDHRVYTSSKQDENGQWSIGMIINYRRRR